MAGPLVLTIVGVIFLILLGLSSSSPMFYRKVEQGKALIILDARRARRHLHRRRRAAGAAQGRDHGHLGEDHRDRAHRPGGPDLPGQHPRRHPDHLLRPGQQDRRGRHQGRPGDRHAPAPATRRRCRSCSTPSSPRRSRRSASSSTSSTSTPSATSSATRSSRSSAPTSTATASRTRRSTTWSRRRCTTLDPNNILDAQGIRKITELTAIEQRAHQRVPAQRGEGDHPAERRRRARPSSSWSAGRPTPRPSSSARSRRMRAREEAETAKVAGRGAAARRAARIATDEQLGVQQENQAREIAVAEKNRERVIADRDRADREGPACSRSSPASARPSCPGSPRTRSSRASSARSPR